MAQTQGQQPQPSNPMFTEQLINKICCSIINRLLMALNCFSAPINDLHELDDGVVLVELIECFEDTMFVKLPASTRDQSTQSRNALSRTQTRSNMEYVESWLKVEGINLDAKRSIKEIFAEIRRSSQELASFLGTFSQDELNDGSSLASMLQKQRMTIYARSIAYISALCYAIFTIFLKHNDAFTRLIPGYNFQVQSDELLHILFYTKWKLTEEELLLKDLEYMRLKDAMDLLEIKNRQLNDLCRMYGMKRDGSEQVTDNQTNGVYTSESVHSIQAQQGQQPQSLRNGRTSPSAVSANSTVFDIKRHNFSQHERQTSDSEQNQDSMDIESVSSVTISSIAEMKTVATLTDIFGLDNEILVRYGFNKKLMAMKDQQIKEKIEMQKQQQKEQQLKQNQLPPNQMQHNQMQHDPRQNQTQNQFNQHENPNQSNYETNHSTANHNQSSMNQSNQYHNPNLVSQSNLSTHHSSHVNQSNPNQSSQSPNLNHHHQQQQQHLNQVNSSSTSDRYQSTDDLSDLNDQTNEQAQFDHESINNSESSSNNFEYNKLLVEMALTGRRPLSTLHEDDDEELPEHAHAHASTAASSSSGVSIGNRHGASTSQHQSRSFIDTKTTTIVPSPSAAALNDNQEAINANIINHQQQLTSAHEPQPSHTHTATMQSAAFHAARLGNGDDEQLQNRIVIARLLAELSYEKNKNMKLRQTNQDYI